MNWIHSTSPSIILQPPLHICNLSITLAIKLAKVIGDLFESGNSMKVDHFRPASILPVLSTILERLMYNRFLKFIEECDISCDSQFGFRKFHAAFVAVAIAVTHIENALQYMYGKNRICVCLNFPKACDTWDHSIFLHRTVLVKSYILNRKQYVLYNGNPSYIRSRTCGVPQGSILGPLLFLICVNVSDMPSCLQMMPACLSMVRT